MKYDYIVTELDSFQSSSEENQNKSRKTRKQGLVKSDVILKCDEC